MLEINILVTLRQQSHSFLIFPLKTNIFISLFNSFSKSIGLKYVGLTIVAAAATPNRDILVYTFFLNCHETNLLVDTTSHLVKPYFALLLISHSLSGE